MMKFYGTSQNLISVQYAIYFNSVVSKPILIEGIESGKLKLVFKNILIEQYN